jgi:hypothetical protein
MIMVRSLFSLSSTRECSALVQSPVEATKKVRWWEDTEEAREKGCHSVREIEGTFILDIVYSI